MGTTAGTTSACSYFFRSFDEEGQDRAHVGLAKKLLSHGEAPLKPTSCSDKK